MELTFIAQKYDPGGIRTHAQKTAALTQRLRPLGHRVTYRDKCQFVIINITIHNLSFSKKLHFTNYYPSLTRTSREGLRHVAIMYEDGISTNRII